MICPPRSELEKLLAEPDDASSDTDLEAHLGVCIDCQQALAEMSNNDEWHHLRGLIVEDSSSTEVVQTRDLQTTKRIRVDPPAEFLAGLKTRLPLELGQAKAPRESGWPTIPGYEILGVLGKGGAAVVYRARHLSLGRLVALKVLSSGKHALGEALARLNVEAGVVAQLHHPHLVQIYEIGHADGVPFLSLEYVDGGSLAQYLSGSPQDPREAAQFVELVALAVHSAHEAGIIHRDLKPANILLSAIGVQELTADGRKPRAESRTPIPKVTDFGLALRIEEVDQRLTETGAVIGTPRYMAPEQAKPNNGQNSMTPATDVHALGVILYEMLTGRPPYVAATTVDTLLKILYDDPVPPGRLCARLPRELEAITLKCLNKDPAHRYPSALELARDLRCFLQGEPVHARPIGLLQRLARWGKRNPAIAGLLIAMIVIALAAFVGISLALFETREAHRLEAKERERTEVARADTLKALERSERSVYFGNIAQARSQWLLNNVRGSDQLLERCPLGLRDWEWKYLDRLNHRDLLTLPDIAPYVSGLAFVPNESWLIIGGGNPFAARNRGTVRTVHADTGKVIWSRDDLTYRVNAVASNPEGRLIAAGGGNFFPAQPGELKLFAAATGQLLHELKGHEHDINSLAFSPDGRRLASASSDRTVRLWDLDPVREVLALKHGGVVLSVAYSPDGRLLFANEEAKIRVWDAESGELVTSFLTQGNQMALSPDGKKIAFESRGGITVSDLGALGGSPLSNSQPPVLHHFAGHTGSVLGLAFHQDSNQLATASADSTVRTWNLESGQEKRVFRGHHGRVGCVAFHPDGKRLASGGQQPGDVKFWDLTQPVDYTPAMGFGEEKADVLALTFVTPGQKLAGLGMGGSLRLRTMTGAQKSEKLGIDVTREWMVPAAVAAFSIDGLRLAAATHRDPRLIKVWQTSSAKETATIRGHDVKVWHVACDRGGDRVASAASDRKGNHLQNELMISDLAQEGQLFKDVSTQRRTLALALTPDGKWLVEACEHVAPTDGVTFEVRMWLETQNWARHRLPGPDQRVISLAISQDGQKLAASYSHGAVMIWDLITTKPLLAQPIQAAELIGSLAFNPSGTRLAGAGRNRTQVWDVVSGQDLLFLRGAPPRHFDNGFNPRIAWSQDGALLANSNWDRTISVWPPLQAP